MSLIYLSNFQRTLDMSLLNCEVSLTLTWSENSVLTSQATRDADTNADPAVAETENPTKTAFKIKDTKLYASVVSLSTKDDDKLLQQLKTGFTETIKWNKYRCEMSN